MLAFLAWFTESGPLYDAASHGLERRLTRYLASRASPSWQGHARHGEGWGLFATAAAPGEWRWPLVSHDESVTAVSVGLPVGLDPESLGAGPLRLARDLIRHDAAMEEVIPPFGFAAVDEFAGKFVCRQDWLGMARLYVYRSQGVVAFSNLPTMLPYALGDQLVPDEDAWAYYIGGDAFSGQRSPVRGVAQLAPGERVVGRRRGDGRWVITTTRHREIDSIVAEAAADRRPDISLAANGIRRACASLSRLWPGVIPFGLSGGKDSRLVAAAMLSAGVVPKFSTRADSPAEADTATRLVELARTSRNIEIGHTVAEAYAPALVATSDLRHRARELMTRYDFTFGSTYLLRPPVAPWPGTVPGPNVGGAVGGIAASTWIPREWPNDDALSRDDLLRAFGAALGRQIRLDFQTPMLRRRLDMLLYDLADRAQELGLRGSQALHWTYLITRQRAWSSASHNLHQVTPLLTPEFLQVAFAMTLREKRDTIVHRELTERLLPEWSGIPWIKNMAGVARADMPQVWDGNGVAVLENLLERPACGLTAMLDRDALRAALRRAKAGAGTGFDGSALRVFTMLSVASDLFGEMNDEIRRESSRMQQAITVHESDTVHRPARHRLRRRIAARMPKQIRHAIRSVRARSEQAPEPAGTAPAR